MSDAFDFDQYLADKAAAAPAPRTVAFAGRVWTIPPEMPLPLSWFIGGSRRDRLEEALRSVFGDQLDALVALDLSEDDVVTLINKVLVPAYRLPPDAAPNSAGSSEPAEPTTEP